MELVDLSLSLESVCKYKGSCGVMSMGRIIKGEVVTEDAILSIAFLKYLRHFLDSVRIQSRIEIHELIGVNACARLKQSTVEYSLETMKFRIQQSKSVSDDASAKKYYDLANSSGISSLRKLSKQQSNRLE